MGKEVMAQMWLRSQVKQEENFGSLSTATFGLEIKLKAILSGIKEGENFKSLGSFLEGT